ncbi:MAG: hypothetical protein QOE85_1148, partial [Actinomycetota bacterium]|nr:hypothetical protein [Actinomycetota bacterium]
QGDQRSRHRCRTRFRDNHNCKRIDDPCHLESQIAVGSNLRMQHEDPEPRRGAVVSFGGAGIHPKNLLSG